MLDLWCVGIYEFGLTREPWDHMACVVKVMFLIPPLSQHVIEFASLHLRGCPPFSCLKQVGLKELQAPHPALSKGSWRQSDLDSAISVSDDPRRSC